MKVLCYELQIRSCIKFTVSSCVHGQVVFVTQFDNLCLFIGALRPFALNVLNVKLGLNLSSCSSVCPCHFFPLSFFSLGLSIYSLY